jgi:hypothetical protein
MKKLTEFMMMTGMCCIATVNNAQQAHERVDSVT